MDSHSRRAFLRSATALGGALIGIAALGGCGTASGRRAPGFGALVADPRGVLDLPQGFTYTVIGRGGAPMDDGFFAPLRPDGMAAFALPDGTTRILRNHEVGPTDGPGAGPFGADSALATGVASGLIYDEGDGNGPLPGGVTAIDFDTRTQTVLQTVLRLAGTSRNCSGGPTPWGSWITCEETTERAGDGGSRDHGFAFEVPVEGNAMGPAVPLEAMGRFRREGVAVDVRSDAVFQTEDHAEGCLYRYRPTVPGDLGGGGALEALTLAGQDPRNWDALAIQPGETVPVGWTPVSPDTTNDDLRLRARAAGAAPFARGEGIWATPDDIYFTCTSGGVAREGQVFRLNPEADTLTLTLEATVAGLPVQPDNLTVAPWGDLLICEDHRAGARLVGVTPEGTPYVLARNVGSTSELTGACLSPDGTTLFINVQDDGLTLAIAGPF